jgi:hypothetical protein
MTTNTLACISGLRENSPQLASEQVHGRQPTFDFFFFFKRNKSFLETEVFPPLHSHCLPSGHFIFHQFIHPKRKRERGRR